MLARAGALRTAPVLISSRPVCGESGWLRRLGGMSSRTARPIHLTTRCLHLNRFLGTWTDCNSGCRGSFQPRVKCRADVRANQAYACSIGVHWLTLPLHHRLHQHNASVIYPYSIRIEICHAEHVCACVCSKRSSVKSCHQAPASGICGNRCTPQNP